jgi:hypothetical protein
MIPRICAKSSLAAFPCIVTMAAILLLQSGCHLGKQKTANPQVSSAPMRIVFLPPNIPADNTDLQWVAMSVPVLMAEASGASPDLEVVPLWESIPVASDVVGPARAITTEMAAEITTRLLAKWVIIGELSSDRKGVSLTVDFMPDKANRIPFRYEKRCSVNSLPENLSEAVSQFLRYVAARALTGPKGPELDAKDIKEIAEALDREHGWFAAAEPGRAEKVVRVLSQPDSRLARMLFNPALYPGINRPQDGSAPQPDAAKNAPANVAADAALLPPVSPNEKTSVPLPSPDVSSVAVFKEGSPEASIPVPQPPANTGGTFAPFQPKPFTPGSTAVLSSGGRVDSGAKNTGASERSPSPAAPGPVSKTPKAETKATKNNAAEGMSKAPPAPRQADYAIQVFSSQSRSNAEATAKKFEKAGLVVEIEVAELKEKGTWYRVHLHGYQSLAAAEAAAAKLQGEGLIKQYWIVR